MDAVPQRLPPKLTPPRRRSDTIRRTRLHGVLSDAFDYDVVLISAPAGYGKSTLAVDWLEEVELPSAWLTLDAQDRDPLRLFANLVAALRVPFPDALGDLAARLEAGAVPTHAGHLVSELASTVQEEIDDLFLVVLDDLHELNGAPEALRVVDALIQSTPLNMRLYLLSRDWPPLASTARAIGQRRALRLTVDDMQFTEEEAIEFLQRSSITEQRGQRELVRRAGGWAAALAILADHYDPERTGGEPVAAQSEFVLADFIEHEVLGRLPAASVDLLTICSIVPSFDADLARDLAAEPEAGELLRDLERTSHLITATGDGRSLRMHALLRDHLAERLERRFPEQPRRLRRTAAALYAQRSMHREAISMSIEAEDWPEAVLGVLDIHDELYQRGEWATLTGWLERLPLDVLHAEPDLLMMRARLATKASRGQAALAELDELPEEGLSAEQRARRELYRSAALRQLNHLPEALSAGTRARALALEELPDDAPLISEIDLEQGIAMSLSGQFEAARDRLEEAAAGFERAADHHRAAEALHELGTVLYDLGWLAESDRSFTEAQRRWRVLADPRALVATMNNKGNVQHMRGELETARDTFNDVVRRSRELREPRFEAYGQESLAVVERDLGNLELAESLYSIALHAAEEIDDAVLMANVTYGLALTYRERGDWSRAETLLDHALRVAEQSGAMHEQVRCLIGLGANRLGEQRFREAVPLLERAAAGATDSNARREEALACLLLASAYFHTRGRTKAIEQLRRMHEIVQELGYDQFLHAEARQMADVLEYAASRKLGGGYFSDLSARLRPVEDGDGAAGTKTAPEAGPRIRAEAFGEPRVFREGRRVTDFEWRSGRSKEMFFLLLHFAAPAKKEQVAVELWPELEPTRLNSNFHGTLYRLRRALGPQVIVQSDEGYQVNPRTPIAYDAREFVEHARYAGRAREGEGEDDWSAHLTAATHLYHGPFLATFDSEWAVIARRQYEQDYVDCLLALARRALRHDGLDEAISLSESVVETDPLNEEAVMVLMRAHARAGALDLATRSYRRLHRLMDTELELEPSEPVQQAYRDILSGAAMDD